MTGSIIAYKVQTFRNAGLIAKWSKTRAGQPVIVLKSPDGLPHQANTWWVCDKSMFDLMQSVGIKAGFDSATVLGDIFSLKA